MYSERTDNKYNAGRDLKNHNDIALRYELNHSNYNS